MSDAEIIAGLYETVTRDDAFPDVLATLAARFDCPAAALVYLDPSRPAANLTLGHGLLDAEVLRRYEETYAALDPCPATFARMKIGEIASTDELFGMEREKHSRFLDEFYLPLGFRETIGGPVTNEEGRFGLIGIIRTDARPPFSKAEIEALARLVPTLRHVLDLRRAFFVSERIARSLRASIDLLPSAVMTFDSRGVLSHANRFARSILARNDGLSLDREGRLHAGGRDAEQMLQGAFSRAAGGAIILRVPRLREDLPYFLRIFPPDQQSDGEGPSIFVSDPARDLAIALPELTRALGLSDPVGRLVAAVSAGIDLRSYAAQNGISYNTARFHLKAAFAATGTQRQADLVRVVGAIIRDLGLAQ